MIAFREMRQDDIPAAMRLKTDAGWNQTPQDWLLFLTLRPGGCFVAVHQDRTIGTVTTVRYGAALGWIGMLLVDPTFRRQGIGARLIERAIGSLEGCACIGLDATPAGLPLYERLGFRPVSKLARLVVEPLPPQPPAPDGGVAIDAQTLAHVARLDRPIFGADRAPLLHALWRRAPFLAWATASGFCLGRKGIRYTQIGPLVAQTAGDAILLCRCAFATLAGTALVLDIPLRHRAFTAWLEHAGFTVQRPLTRMLLETNRMPGLSTYQFAIAGPEIG